MNSPDSPSTKRHFRSTVTINSANTWERKTVTIPGDSQLVFDDNNEAGLSITWHYASGPNFSNGTHVTGSWDTTAVAGNRSSSSNINIYSNTSNFVSLTGVQLEVGDTATSFEHRSISDELARCQRYFYKHFIVDAIGPYFTQYHATHKFVHTFFPVSMRDIPTPTVTYNTGSPTAYKVTTDHFKAYEGSAYDSTVSIYMTAAQYDAEI